MAGRLAGVITDGDLRRHFEEIATTTASTVMTRTPTTVTADMRAQDVLDVLNEKHITAAFVMEPNAPVNHNVPVGIVHLHDFLRMGLR
jgi:arabinose-5-phosphate isomerase